MAFVDNRQKIVREIIEQAERPCAGIATVEIARVVFDTGTVSHFADHLHVVGYPFIEPFGFQVLADRFEKLHLFAQVDFDFADSPVYPLFRGDEDIGRENIVRVECRNAVSRSRIDSLDTFDLFPPEDDADDFLVVCQINIYRIAFYPEISPVQFYFVPAVKSIYQPSQKCVSPDIAAYRHFDHIAVEIFGVADTVEARHRRYDNNIFTPRQERGGGR